MKSNNIIPLGKSDFGFAKRVSLISFKKELLLIYLVLSCIIINIPISAFGQFYSFDKYLNECSSRSHFVKNAGQWEKGIFLGQGNNGQVWFETNQIVFDLQDTKYYFTKEKVGKGLKVDSVIRKGHTFELEFLESNPNPQILFGRKQNDYYNFLIGKNEGSWITNCPTYDQFIYKNIYNNIDLRLYHNNDDKLEIDYILHPETIYEPIKFKVNHADSVRLDSSNRMTIYTSLGPLVFEPPIAYAIASDQTIPIAVNYHISGDDISFELDSALFIKLSRYPIIIDPTIQWSTQFTGMGSFSNVYDLAIYPNGDVLIGGDEGTPNFPVTVGAYDTTFGNLAWSEGFVARINKNGDSLRFCTYLGGSDAELIDNVALDDNLNIYVSGNTQSADFPVTAGSSDDTYNGGLYGDAFITKLNPTGTALIFSTYLGGSDNDEAYGMDLDDNYNVYVCGYTKSNDFPTAIAFDGFYNGGISDCFVSKLDASGTFLQYSTYLGGSNEDISFGMQVDANHCAYITGFTRSINFPHNIGSLNGYADLFITKLGPLGNSLSYSNLFGGSYDDTGYGIELHSGNQVAISGFTGSDDYPVTPGALYQSAISGVNVMLANVDSNGQVNIAGTVGGTQDEYGYGISSGPAGTFYIIGNTTSFDLPVSLDAFDASSNGGYDMFLMQLNANFSSINYSTYIGGSGSDTPCSFAEPEYLNGGVYIPFLTTSNNFPLTPGAYQDTPLQTPGSYAGGVLKFYSPYTYNVGLNGIDSLCYGDTLLLNLHTTGGMEPFQFTWNVQPDSMINDSVSMWIIDQPIDTISVTVTDANNVVGNASFLFHLKACPFTIYCNATQTTDCNNLNSSIQTTILGGTPPFIYNWSNGASTSFINGLKMGSYKVNVTDQSGDTATCLGIITNPICIVATQLVSPNNDGKNDTWIIQNIQNYPNNSVKIYNRWGNLVYDMENYDNTWNGNFMGQPLPPGTYFYAIHIHPESVAISGFIELQR